MENRIESAITHAAAKFSGDSSAERQRDYSIFAKQPRTLEEVGLSRPFLADLMLKIMHYSGTPSAATLVRRLGLNQTIVEKILKILCDERICEFRSQSDLFASNFRYHLSERGLEKVAEALQRTRYAGPAPVTAEQYADTVRLQQAQRRLPRPERIRSMISELVLAPEVADKVAQAYHSGKTVIFHGPSGSGKTSIMERLARSSGAVALIPHAIYAHGQVIRVFDPSVHEPVWEADDSGIIRDDSPLDQRWVLVKRPVIVLGLETDPESLEPAYDPKAGFYQAPPHVKAQGGILIIDDLGRQTVEPRQALNRWLISVERGQDSLSLVSGEMLTVPFDVQLLLATDQPVASLADDPLMRRIAYKVEIPNSGPEELAEILRRLCQRRNIEATQGVIERVVEMLYRECGGKPSPAQAGYLLEVLIESAAYEKRERVLDEESFERAFRMLGRPRPRRPVGN